MITSPLKTFQKQTISWMIDQEQQHQGGLLFNEPGTGKSICCLDLVVKTSCKKTLIICPAGLVSNWVNEIKKHTTFKDDAIFVYTGRKRSRLKQTQNHIFFISSYSIVSREICEIQDNNNNFESESLFNDNFSRVILDEAHYIRNWNRKIFKSVMCIKSELKWIVTATPIFNKVDDIYSYFRFLELESIDSRREWQRLIHDETSGSGIRPFKRLNDVVNQHSLLLKKSNVLADELKPKNEVFVNVNLTPFESNFYESLWDYSMQRMRALTLRLKNLSGLQDMNSKMMKQLLTNNILVYILRLKQSCNNPWLVISKMKRLKNVQSLQRATERLAFFNTSMNMEEECPVCYDNIANSIASPCGHKCCNGCWDKIMRFGINKCPKCRSEIDTIDDITTITVNEPGMQQTTESNAILENEIKCSSKVKELLRIIDEKRTLGEKIVVVSQWIKMLDIVKDIIIVKYPNIKIVSLQGDIPMKKRMESVDAFQNDKSIQICLVSLMSSAEGINLTAANNLILLDTWWNDSKMIQVSDRIHRIGQLRDVNIYKLVVGGENSIEERVQRLVSKKAKLKNLIMNKWKMNESEMEKYDDNWIQTPVRLLG
jgi:SWI/SNF-related matrix-associated actin-dependent regulator of chromatin subfamily A3